MAIKMTIIGLGQIGASIGMALADRKDLLVRVGHDSEPTVARRAQKLGAVDQIEINLPRSVENASIVLLCIPIDQIPETLQVIAPDLKEGCVVLDTAPVKAIVARWADELLPERCYYIGLTPVVNPAYLMQEASGLDAAHPDLFRDGMMAIVSSSRSSSEAIKLAADLTRLIGATPMFFDSTEIDSLMAAIHQLPLLLAAALLNATVDQPGWVEARKVTGSPYARVTAPFQYWTGSSGVASSMVHNRQNVLRVLDNLNYYLQALRAEIEDGDQEGLAAALERASHARQTWWRQRQEANWALQELETTQELPTSSQVLGRLIGLGRRRRSGA